MSSRAIAVGASAVSLAAMTALGITVYSNQARAKSEKLWTEPPAQEATQVVAPDFADIADRVRPAVVSVTVHQDAKVSSHDMRRGHPGMQLPEGFREFFPGFNFEMPHSMPRDGAGSGFFIREDGLILTNNHVVEDADRIEVTMRDTKGDERTMTAKVVGTAPEYDVALIKTDEDPHAPVVPLGSSKSLRIGEWVLAIGNPFGLGQSMSVGIVSAKERRDIAPSGRRGLYDFIQTDASINPGNSGGPLVNGRGEVIGINSAINAQGQGIGFAIPIDMVKRMLPQLQKNGKFGRGWLGVQIQDVNDELASSFGLDRPQGALVAQVVDDGPAKKAGLKDGDIVLSFNDQPVRDASDLPLLVGMAEHGKASKVVVWRDGKRKTFAVTIGDFPGDEQSEVAGTESEHGQLGMALSDATPGVNVPDGSARGALVRGVEPDSLAARAGLRPGDIIVSINGDELADAAAATRRLKNAKAGSVVRMRILRDDVSLFVALRLPK